MMAFFVGGSWDGETHDVGMFPPRYMVPIPIHESSHVDEMRFMEIVDGCPVRAPLHCDVQVYARRRLPDGDARGKYIYEITEGRGP